MKHFHSETVKGFLVQSPTTVQQDLPLKPSFVFSMQYQLANQLQIKFKSKIQSQKIIVKNFQSQVENQTSQPRKNSKSQS